MRIALWGAFDIEDSGRLSTAMVVAAELRRRLPGAAITAFAPLGRRRPLGLDGGRPAEPLGGLDAAAAAASFDCILVCGEDALCGSERRALLWDDPAASAPLIDGLGAALEHRCTVVWAGVSLPDTPDRDTAERLAAAAPRRSPIAALDAGSRRRLAELPVDGDVELIPPHGLLLGRLLDPRAVESRSRLQRRMGWACEPGSVLTIAGDSRMQADVDTLVRALLPGVESGTLAVQLVVTGRYDGEEAFAATLERALGGRCRRQPGIAPIEDTAAAISSSTAVLAPPGPSLWLAAALGVPAAAVGAGEHAAVLALLGVPELTRETLGEGVRRLLDGDIRAADPAAAIAQLDGHLDRLAGVALSSALRRSGGTVPVSGAPDAETALRTAHEALGRQVLAERRIFESERAAAVRDLEAEVRDARDEVERLRAELRAARAANDAIVGSRTWRYTQPVRDTLARVRERRR